MNTRIKELMVREGLTSIRLAAILEVQPSAISHILSGRNKPGYEMICALLKSFPAYNAEWLILGQGEMMKREESENLTELGNDSDDEPVVTVDSESEKRGVAQENGAGTTDASAGCESSTQIDCAVKIIELFPDGTFAEYHKR